MYEKIYKSITGFFTDNGFSEFWAETVYTILGYVLLLVVSLAIYKLTVVILKLVIFPITKRSKGYFDDLLVKNRFFRRLAFLAPALFIYYILETDLFIHQAIDKFSTSLVIVFFYIIGALIIESVISTIDDYYNRFHIAKDHPISGVIQVLKIIVYIGALLAIIGFLSNKDISTLLVGLGTLSAVLMLIFKDPILGFVGGLQLMFNKMIAIGDWINVPKYGADGTVLEVNLTVVKVENFDKTIVTVPTYSLITNSFQNYRGMQESGGRRIKRAINIDMESVKFCDEAMLEKFSKIQLITKYIKDRQQEIEDYNKKNNIDPSVLVNGRRQTNIGVFMQYLKEYLHERKDIHQDMTFLVRQLAPTDVGIPIQIYVFTATTVWNEYEDIQSSIFDHVLAIIPEFELKVFQSPSNNALSQLIAAKNS